MDSLELNQRKKEMRAKVRKLLSAIPPDHFSEIGLSMKKNLCTSEIWKRAQSVFCYYSTDSEPDTVPILHAALYEGKALYLPRCIKGVPGEMELVRICSLSDVTFGSYSILEPVGTETTAPDKISLAVIPCLACDQAGMRLGHGGGYYDRFLAAFRGDSVVACPEMAVFPEIPEGEFDRRSRFILTESGLFSAKDKSFLLTE